MKTIKPLVLLCALLGALSISSIASAGVFDGYPSTVQFDPMHPHPTPLPMKPSMEKQMQQQASKAAMDMAKEVTVARGTQPMDKPQAGMAMEPTPYRFGR